MLLNSLMAVRAARGDGVSTLLRVIRIFIIALVYSTCRVAKP